MNLQSFCPICVADRVQRIAAEILKVLNPLVPEHQGVSFVIGASIGIVMLDEQFENPQRWLEAADAAKRSGRGQMHFDHRNLRLPERQFDHAS